MCAKVSSLLTRVFLDEIDISGFINAAELSLQQELAVVTCFSDAGPRRLVGNYDHAFSHSGFFDGADDSFDEQVFDNFSADEDHYLTQLFGANAAGSVAYNQVIRLQDQPRSASLGGAVLLNLSGEGSGGLCRGLVLANATVTGAGDEAGIEQGATTSGQVYEVVFRVLAFSGTNIVLKVQESQNDGSPDTYADVTGLTSGTLTAPSVVRVTTTAATEAWKRVNVSSPGGFTSALILVTAGTVQA